MAQILSPIERKIRKVNNTICEVREWITKKRKRKEIKQKVVAEKKIYKKENNEQLKKMSRLQADRLTERETESNSFSMSGSIRVNAWSQNE